ncbi:MAG: hypothetical protein QXO63_02770, partial [Thermoplasmatales archaeon]
LFKTLGKFKLTGKSESGQSVVLNNCYLTSISQSTSKSDVKFFAKFDSFEAIENPERLNDSPKNEILVEFGLLNIDKTFRVMVGTRLGKLCLLHIKDYEEYLRTIKLQGISVATAIAQIHIEKRGVERTFKDILSDSIDVIHGFLQITSLAQTCYHNWCWVKIYEKTGNSEDYEPVLCKMISPKIKKPVFRGLTNPAHSSRFIQSAYKGYCGREEELREQYDFDIALEWYLEANIASVLESQYLMACICLELLVDRFSKRSRREYVLDPDIFKKELYPRLKKALSEFLETNPKITPTQRDELYAKIRGLNRWSFKTQIKSLLNYLGVKYDDLFDDLQIIVEIRNRLTHEGKYEDTGRLLNVYNRLYVLLSRVFLAILNYDDEYWDWVKQEFVHFKDVMVTNRNTNNNDEEI